MERTNARYLESLPEPVQRVSVDVSFISLDLILPRAYGWLADGGQAVVLIKPQFEAGADRVGKGGVVRDAGDASGRDRACSHGRNRLRLAGAGRDALAAGGAGR